LEEEEENRTKQNIIANASSRFNRRKYHTEEIRKQRKYIDRMTT